jgi:hypothetical protein
MPIPGKMPDFPTGPQVLSEDTNLSETGLLYQYRHFRLFLQPYTL